MKFLWQSNAPWAGTGYGVQTRLMLDALKGLGHEPRCFAFYGLSGGGIQYDGYPVYPNSDYDTWGNDVVGMHLDRSKSDLLITLMDLFILDRKVYGNLPTPWAAWTPIDSVEMGEPTHAMLKRANYPIAMSNFGAEQMKNYEIEPFATIYHAVDTEIFKPMDKAECRAELGLEQDAYFVGMVMANKGNRKMFPLQFKAIKKFFDSHNDERMCVYQHTDPTSGMGGFDIRELVRMMGLKGSSFNTNQYDTSVVPTPPETMAKIYNSFDVLLNCSAGEGFGVPIVEAQACGVPVVTHGVTAMPEITQNGYTVESSSTDLMNHYGWQFWPDVEDMAYRLECVYRMANSNANALGRQWVEANCSVPVIASQWDGVLRDIEKLEREKVLAARRWL